MDNVGEFLKGFGLGIAAGVGAAIVIGFAVAASYPHVGAGAVVVALICLAAYVAVLAQAFRRGRTWFGFGLLVALLLGIPTITTACFPNTERDSPSERPRSSGAARSYGPGSRVA